MSLAVSEAVIRAVRAAPRLCFFAHFHQGAILADHVHFYLKQIVRAGFTVVLLSTSMLTQADAEKLDALGVFLVYRENEGLDFGGWIQACQEFNPVLADLLLLANDSVYGPIGDLSAFLDRLLAVPADVYGALESGEIERHLQSWFLLFRRDAFNSAAFRSLMMTPMPVLASKWALIDRYEVGLTRRLRAAGFRIHAAVRAPALPGLAGRWPFNPTHVTWRELIESGVPFLKVDLLRSNPMRATDLRDWREVVAARQPALVPMIENDLRRRPPIDPPSWAAQSRWSPIYWPETRAVVRALDRRVRAGRHTGFLGGVFVAIVAFAAAPRLALRAWRKARP